MVSVLKDVTSQAKKLNGSMGEQADKETKLLLDRLQNLGLLKENPTLDAVLDLTLENILDRRLQSMVFKQGLARTMKQARQFIVHSHIAVKGTPITQPSHLVTIDEEKALTFVPRSALSDPEHPERSLKPQEQPKPAEVKAEAPATGAAEHKTPSEHKTKGASA